MRYTRITVNPNQMNGVPCIRNLRIPVATVVSMLADGVTEEEILRAYPDLEREDIREAPQYATEAVRERELPMEASVRKWLLDLQDILTLAKSYGLTCKASMTCGLYSLCKPLMVHRWGCGLRDLPCSAHACKSW